MFFALSTTMSQESWAVWIWPFSPDPVRRAQGKEGAFDFASPMGENLFGFAQGELRSVHVESDACGFFDFARDDGAKEQGRETPHSSVAVTARRAVQQDKSRIERIHVRTPSDEDGNAVTAEYSVVIEISKFDPVAGKKLLESALVKTSSFAEVQSLMSELPESGIETLDTFIKRVADDFWS